MRKCDELLRVHVALHFHLKKVNVCMRDRIQAFVN